MNKIQQGKFKKQIKEYLIDKKIYEKVYDVLIQQLCDWIVIDVHTKKELEKDPNNWVTVSTISVASKNIQNIMTKLQLIPQLSKKVEVQSKPVALEDVIKEITSTR